MKIVKDYTNEQLGIIKDCQNHIKFLTEKYQSEIEVINNHWDRSDRYYQRADELRQELEQKKDPFIMIMVGIETITPLKHIELTIREFADFNDWNKQ